MIVEVTCRKANNNTTEAHEKREVWGIDANKIARIGQMQGAAAVHTTMMAILRQKLAIYNMVPLDWSFKTS